MKHEFCGHWKKFENKEYLGSWDLDESPNKQIVATIVEVTIKEVMSNSGRKELCRVATFRENIKPMILNVGNTEIFTKFLGTSRVEQWHNINVPVTIIVKNEKIKGEYMDCLRLSKMKPKMKEELTINHPAFIQVIEAVSKGYTINQVKNKYIISNTTEDEIIKRAKVEK